MTGIFKLIFARLPRRYEAPKPGISLAEIRASRQLPHRSWLESRWRDMGEEQNQSKGLNELQQWIKGGEKNVFGK